MVEEPWRQRVPTPGPGLWSCACLLTFAAARADHDEGAITGTPSRKPLEPREARNSYFPLPIQSVKHWFAASGRANRIAARDGVRAGRFQGDIPPMEFEFTMSLVFSAHRLQI